jgi:hypothetical protein
MNRLTNFVLPVALGAAFLCACGGDDDDAASPDAAPLGDAATADAATADAAPDAATADAAPEAAPPADAFAAVGSPSCDEFMTPITTLGTFPASYDGDLAGAEANVNITPEIPCTSDDAPAGHDTPGPDHVVALTGLTPGTTYFVLLQSEEDLAAFVVTGCDPANVGFPGADQCLAYVDSAGSNSTEAQSFVAPADGKAFVVVDFWKGDIAPKPTTYNLKITANGCVDETTCTDPSAPFCGEDHQCSSAGYCVGDDTTAEAASDDSPAGATVVALAGAPVVLQAHVCSDDNQAVPEFDYYQFVAVNGGAVTVTMAWDDTSADLDMALFNSDGNTIGLSFWENPEKIQMTFLPAGTYFVRVARFTPSDTAVTPYTITFTPDPTVACTSDASCAANVRNQFFRPDCNAQGACVKLDGAGMVALGGTCDDGADCVAAADGCSNSAFMSNPDTRSICTLGCTNDAECATVGAGFKCTTGGNGGDLCTPPCNTDDQCPTDRLSMPAAGQPWLHATCDVSDHHCAF